MADLRVPDLNFVLIAGRLTRDPELRYTSGGRAFCRLSVANTRYYKSKEGERRESTTFVDGTTWDKQAEWMGERLKKGRPVIVEGQLQTSEWEDKESGQKRSRLQLHISRVTPLDWDDDGRGAARGGGGQAAGSGGGYGGGQSAGGYGSRPASAPDPRQFDEPLPEDDIPF